MIKSNKKAVFPALLLALCLVSLAVPGKPVQAADMLSQTPELSAPANGSTVSTLRPKLQWSPSETVAGYAVQVSTDPGFTMYTVNVTGIREAYLDLPGLSAGTRYYWRVGYSASPSLPVAWSPAWSFRIASSPLPAQPEKLAAVPLSFAQVVLSWEDRSANEIKFKLERKTSGGSYLQVAALRANATAYTDSNLRPETVYYYRIRAYGIAGDSPYSTPAVAATLPLPPPVPVLMWPVNGAIVRTVNPRLQWSASGEMATYSIQVATDYDFSSIILNQSGVTEPAFQVPSGFLRWESGFYWRVMAKSPAGAPSAWSASRYFSVYQEPRSSFSCGCGH